MTTPPTDPIRDAFEAMLAFFALLFTRRRSQGDPSYTIDLGEDAAADMLGSSAAPPRRAIELRDLVQRAAEEHARRTQPQPAEHTDDPPLTEEELRAAEERCERATAGPWEQVGNNVTAWDGEGGLLMEWMPNGVPTTNDADACNAHHAEDRAFIAAARTDLPCALREIRRLRRVEALVGGLEQANREAHQGLAKRKAEIERLTRELAEARRVIAATEAQSAAVNLFG